MSSVETGQMSAVETGQMSAAETGQMSAVETRQMSTIATGRCPVLIRHRACRHEQACGFSSGVVEVRLYKQKCFILREMKSPLGGPFSSEFLLSTETQRKIAQDAKNTAPHVRRPWRSVAKRFYLSKRLIFIDFSYLNRKYPPFR